MDISNSTQEEYINMEVDSFASLLCHPTNEFEFSNSSKTDETITSTADQLFYMGKLLPLDHLQMLDKILQNPKMTSKTDELDDDDDQLLFSTPLFTTTCNTSAPNTPFESCNISPVESCQVSRELNPDQYFLEYSTSFQEKKTWGKRLKLIKQSSSIGSKLKWAYLKSWFTKSGCSHESSAAARNVAGDGKKPVPNGRERAKMSIAAAKNVVPFGQIQRVKNIDCKGDHRRSFSGAFKRLSKSKTSTNTSTLDSRYGNIKRSSSTNLELENSIQAAIAHCKRSHSQQQFYSRNIASELIICSISASSKTIMYDDQERSPILCRA